MKQDAPLEQRVRAWLGEQGYPLEMRTAAVLRAEGLTVRQSQYYLDPETQKSREIDALCFVDDDLGVASLRLVVECKSGDKPWIVFSSAHTLADYNRLFPLGVLSESMRGALADDILDLSGRLSWFKKDGRVGYGVAQAFSNGDDRPFAAAMSAVKASLWQHSEDGGYQPPLLAAFPVVVVDAPVFECYRDDQGSLQLSEVPAIDYFFGAGIGSFSGTCVRIVSAKALPVYCREAKAELAALLAVLEPAIKQHWDALKTRTRAAARGTVEQPDEADERGDS